MSAGARRDSRFTAPVVPAGGRFEGVVAFRGRARIDGEVVGPVEGTGQLELGEGARVEGRVDVDELVSRGLVEGDVSARHRACLEAGATLRGTLTSPRLAVANGAVIQGRCSTGSDSG
ncbi:MAG TPA: polymer-forming cytoskeletal protein [Alphaproteobacteria bacterium]|nr:polymer-forming cytoskeletal protein [Alphaproteobacteria bacterium]